MSQILDFENLLVEQIYNYPNVAQYLEVEYADFGMSRLNPGSTLIEYPENSFEISSSIPTRT